MGLKYLPLSILLFPLLAFAQTSIPTIDQFTATTSPSAAITQRVWGKTIKLTGLTTGLCLTLDNNSLLTTTSCGSGGGSTFPFTPQTDGNATSTVIIFKNGLYTTASSTLSNLHLPLSNGELAINSGLIYSTATTTFSTGLSYLNGVVTNTGILSNAGDWAGTWQTFSPSHFQIAGAYLTAYDAWTHAISGYSATTTNLYPTGLQTGTSTIGTLNATSSLIVPLSGVLKGNGSSAVTVASNGTDFSLISALSCTAGNHLATVSASGAFTCSADTGSGSLGYTAWGGSMATTYSTTTVASTTPAWFKTSLYASSTIANPSIIDNLSMTNATTTGNFSIGAYKFSTSSVDYLDMRNTNNASYTIQRIISPLSTHNESTLSLVNFLNGILDSTNQEFVDFYNEDYNNSVQAGIRQAYQGTGVAKPFVFGHWNKALGAAGKDVGNQFLLMPNGTVAAAVATSTVNTAAMLYVASSTAADPFMVDTTPGTTKLTVAANGNVTVGGGALIVNGNSQINGGNSLVLRNAAGNSDIFCFNNGASSANLLDCSDFTGSLPITFDGTLTLTHALTAANGGTGATSLSPAFTVSSNVYSNVVERSFTYSTTTWTGSTTIPILQATIASTISGVRCKTYLDSKTTSGGTLNVQFGKGSASTTMLNASSTNNLNTFTTNNTVAAGDSWSAEIGTPASSPRIINCTYKLTI